MSKFFTKSGWLTPYAMACGYRHFTENEKTDTRVYFDCANAETQQYDVVIVVDGTRTQWECFQGATPARAFYKRNVTRLFGGLRYRFENNPDVNRSVIV